MSTDLLSEPVCHTKDDVQARLATIDHRLHQRSTHLATLGTLLCPLDETRANLDTLIASLTSPEPIVARAACELPGYGQRAP
ncbi:MAG: hypothetical protein ACRDRE_11665 [Pseudonocardiaceae bacterium]